MRARYVLSVFRRQYVFLRVVPRGPDRRRGFDSSQVRRAGQGWFRSAPGRVQGRPGAGLSRTVYVPTLGMVEQKDEITEERRILKKAGVLDDKLLDKMDIYPGDRVRFRFYYPHSGFEEILGHFVGFYTLYEGPEGGGDLNLVIRMVKDGRTTVVYKDRNYLEEFEVLEPNLEVRDQIKDLDARHGRHVGHEFG